QFLLKSRRHPTAILLKLDVPRRTCDWRSPAISLNPRTKCGYRYLATCHFKIKITTIILEGQGAGAPEIVNADLTVWALHFFARTRVFVQTTSVDLNGRIHGRCLIDIPHHACHSLIHLLRT